MNIVVAMDSFKGSMTAEQACQAAARGLKRALPTSHVVCMPVADGGEGLIETLQHCPTFIDARLIHVDVTGPYSTKVNATYLRKGKTAIIEMAQSCGLELTPVNERDTRFATSYGLGEIFMHAVRSGCKHLIIGLGGSATNDAGMGFAQALGVDFYDCDGELIPVPARACNMQHVTSIDITRLDPQFRSVSVEVCCDVNNPLLGENGATRIYGPQKGAAPEAIEVLERAMTHYASKVESVVTRNAQNIPGSGAAGGMGAALMWFTDAKLKPGIQLVLDLIYFDNTLTNSHLVITGEGKIDKQTAFGKVPSGVAQRAAAKGVPVIALAGSLDWDNAHLNIPNIQAMHAIVQQPIPLDEAMDKGEYLMEITAEQIGATLNIGQKLSSM